MGADGDATVLDALRVQKHVIVNHGAIADVDLVRMPQGDIEAEHHSLSAGSQKRRIQELSQEQAESARHLRGQKHHELEVHETEEVTGPDHEVLILLGGGAAI